jgi:hypothetical protein
MGISGLLPQLRSATTSINVVDLRGIKVAIDGYGWLHRGVHGCAAELGMGKVSFHIPYYLVQIEPCYYHYFFSLPLCSTLIVYAVPHSLPIISHDRILIATSPFVSIVFLGLLEQEFGCSWCLMVDRCLPRKAQK